MTRRILLFEDNQNYCEVLHDLFDEDHGQIYLTASYGTGRHAVQRVRQHRPDLVLMDIEMPDTSGLEALRQLRLAGLETKVLIQTQFFDEHRIFVALCRGANGYSLKTDPLEQLERAIEDTCVVGGYISPAIAGIVMRFFQRGGIGNPNVEYYPLTPREMEVLELLGDHYTYQRIADSLHVTYHTVHEHIKSIYRKLHVNSKSEAIMRAVESKLI